MAKRTKAELKPKELKQSEISADRERRHHFAAACGVIAGISARTCSAIRDLEDVRLRLESATSGDTAKALNQSEREALSLAPEVERMIERLRELAERAERVSRSMKGKP